MPRGALAGRGELHARLLARRDEIEQAALTRVHAISDPGEVSDPQYLDGLRSAVSAALDYAMAAIELGEEGAPPIPVTLLSQARLAARNGVEIDTVLRRYLAGHTLLGDFVMQEVESLGLRGDDLKRLLRTQAALFDRLLAAVTEEHSREGGARFASSEERRVQRVQSLLDGELVDAATLQYDFGAHHLGAVAAGREVGEALRDLAAAIDRRLLLVRHDEEIVWAWFGGRRELEPGALEHAIGARGWPSDAFLALGVPATGLDGWRLTHRQAKAALSIALRGAKPVVRYADVALLSSMVRDDLLVTSLREIYLSPLASARDEGEMLRHTLRAYFETDRNSASAAAVLGVTRQTVNNRLRNVEDRLRRPLRDCATELEVTLLMEALGREPRRASTR